MFKNTFILCRKNSQILKLTQKHLILLLVVVDFCNKNLYAKSEWSLVIENIPAFNLFLKYAHEFQTPADFIGLKKEKI